MNQELEKIKKDLDELEAAYKAGQIPQNEYENYKEHDLKLIADLEKKMENVVDRNNDISLESLTSIKESLTLAEPIVEIDNAEIEKIQRDLVDLEQAFNAKIISGEEYEKNKARDNELLQTIRNELSMYSNLKNNIESLERLTKPTDSIDLMEYNEEVNARKKEIKKSIKYLNDITKKVEKYNGISNVPLTSNEKDDIIIQPTVIEPVINDIVMPKTDIYIPENKKIVLPGDEEYPNTKIVLPGEDENTEKKIYLPDGSAIDLSFENIVQEPKIEESITEAPKIEVSGELSGYTAEISDGFKLDQNENQIDDLVAEIRKKVDAIEYLNNFRKDKLPTASIYKALETMDVEDMTLAIEDANKILSSDSVYSSSLNDLLEELMVRNNGISYTEYIANNPRINDLDDELEDDLDLDGELDFEETEGLSTDDKIVNWIIERVNNNDLEYSSMVKRSLDENNLFARLENPLVNELSSKRILIYTGGNGIGNDHQENYKISYARVRDFVSQYEGPVIEKEEKEELLNRIDDLFVEEVKNWADKSNFKYDLDTNTLMEVFKISEEEANKVVSKLNANVSKDSEPIVSDSEPIIPDTATPVTPTPIITATPITPVTPSKLDYKTSIVKKADSVKLENDYKKRLINASNEKSIFTDESRINSEYDYLTVNNAKNSGKLSDTYESVDINEGKIIPVRVFKEAGEILKKKIDLTEFQNVVVYKLSNLKNIMDEAKDYTRYAVDRLVEQMVEGKVDTDGNPIMNPSYDEYSASRSMGYSKLGLIALLTGILSIGIIMLGTFLIK